MSHRQDAGEKDGMPDDEDLQCQLTDSERRKNKIQIGFGMIGRHRRKVHLTNPDTCRQPALETHALNTSACEFVERDDRFSWTFHVGPAGGVLQVMTIILSIPEGALKDDAAITIVVSTNKQDTPSLKDGECLAGPVIHCLPHGLRFHKTVTLSFGYNEHLAAAVQAKSNLHVMSSDTDMGEPPSWTFVDSATSNFLVGSSRRCLVFLDHFCSFTVISRTAGEELLAKGVIAMVCAEYLAAARTMLFRVSCVDDETTAKELFKYICSKPGLGTLTAREPFIMYNNGKDVDTTLSTIRSGWTAEGDVTKNMSFLKVWRAMQPSCTFQLSRWVRDETADVQQALVSCVITTGQRGSGEDDAAQSLIIGHVSRFDEPRKYNMERNYVKYDSVIPHQMKMALATLLDPTDHVSGRDWRLLASELGLDEKVRYLETKSNPTEILLAVWETKSSKLPTLASLLRSIGREDAAFVVESHLSATHETTVEAPVSATLPSGEDLDSTDILIPDKLKSELAVLLDPIDVVSGHDWRHLASQLELDDKIRYFQSKGDPTHRLMNICEIRNVGMSKLVAMMRTMEREDAARAIETYISSARDESRDVTLAACSAAVSSDDLERETQLENCIDGHASETKITGVSDEPKSCSPPHIAVRKCFLSGLTRFISTRLLHGRNNTNGPLKGDNP